MGDMTTTDADGIDFSGSPGEDVDFAGSPGYGRRPVPKWPFVLAGVFIAIGIAIAIAWPIKVSYYTMSPGPLYDASDFVHVADGQENIDGEFFFLTVSLREANVFEYVAATIDPRIAVVPRQNIRPSGVSSEDLRRENLARMEQSKTDAKVVALTKLGYEVTYIGTGALVIDTIPDSAADGVLFADDVIVAVDGEDVAFRSDVIDDLADNEIGDSVVITVERSVEGSDEPETVDVTLVLGPHVDDPSKPMMGVLLDNNPTIFEFPVDVEIDSQNIGGPSAGLMFTLEIMNQLTEEDITGGQRIAGTGTISLDGTVGAIGGVRQKVYAAIDAGATIVFVPAANFDDAVDAAGDDVTVVRVETIDDPLEYLGATDLTTTR
jgi:PDZ domain-containing protein